jgi:hypothetical protein
MFQGRRDINIQQLQHQHGRSDQSVVMVLAWVNLSGQRDGKQSEVV